MMLSYLSFVSSGPTPSTASRLVYCAALSPLAFPFSLHKNESKTTTRKQSNFQSISVSKQRSQRFENKTARVSIMNTFHFQVPNEFMCAQHYALSFVCSVICAQHCVLSIVRSELCSAFSAQLSAVSIVRPAF